MAGGEPIGRITQTPDNAQLLQGVCPGPGEIGNVPWPHTRVGQICPHLFPGLPEWAIECGLEVVGGTGLGLALRGGHELSLGRGYAGGCHFADQGIMADLLMFTRCARHMAALVESAGR